MVIKNLEEVFVNEDMNITELEISMNYIEGVYDRMINRNYGLLVNYKTDDFAFIKLKHKIKG